VSTASSGDVEWVLVTGASRGIGRAIAERLSADGYGVILWGRTAEDLDDIAERAGANARVAVVDVADFEAVEVADADTLGDLPSLRGVILNAGYGRWGPLSGIGVADWHQTIGTNLDGAFYTLKSTLSRVEQSPAGQVIGIASDSALYPFPGRAAYCASKAGMKSLLESVRLDTRGQGVRTTLVFPSRVDTFFGGKRPGDRAGALSAGDIADIISVVLALPRHLEIRELHVASITESFGPFEERMALCPQHSASSRLCRRTIAGQLEGTRPGCE